MTRETTQLRDGRTVVHMRGTRTQTVNVCTADNRPGEYERVYRLPIGEVITLAELAEQASPATLHEAMASRNGVQVDADGRARAVLSLVEVEPDPAWLATATAAVDAVLDEAVTAFLHGPYLHRVEHSLHAELYRQFKAQPALQGEHPLRTGELTQLVHKEWPETRPDLTPGGSGRRGAFDLAVLAPQQLAAADLEHFRHGRIAASLAIEVGLDYGWDHLDQDGDKLRASRVAVPYLLHLSRTHAAEKPTIEAYVEAAPQPLRVAYVHHDPGVGTTLKRLRDRTVQAG